jgi:hypothetical protein
MKQSSCSYVPVRCLCFRIWHVSHPHGGDPRLTAIEVEYPMCTYICSTSLCCFILGFVCFIALIL